MATRSPTRLSLSWAPARTARRPRAVAWKKRRRNADAGDGEDKDEENEDEDEEDEDIDDVPLMRKPISSGALRTLKKPWRRLTAFKYGH